MKLCELMQARILLVDDEPNVLASLRRRLAFDGFQVSTAVTGMMALEMLEGEQPDLIVLDVMLPEVDGFEVTRRLRAAGVETPILLLTARDNVQDRVRGLEIGADDYLCKPFAVEELLARIKVLLRRSRPGAKAPEQLSFAGLCLDPASREVTCDGAAVSLTLREFELLAFFLRHPREVLSRDRIFDGVWGHDAEGASNVIDVHVRALREKLPAKLIQTVRGVGYVLREEA